jgi:protein MpaA
MRDDARVLKILSLFGAPVAVLVAAAPAPARVVVLGHSWQGRPINAVQVGDSAGTPVLVVGCVHGNETGGIRIARALERLSPRGLDLWIVADLNPDGVAARARRNAHGVDLNRNFPYRWRMLGRYGDPTWSGPEPLSEPESRIARALIRRLHPAVTIWFHQPLGLVDRSGGDVRIERRFARRIGLPLRHIPAYPGTATRWQNHRFPGATAFVVELPRGSLARRLRDRCVKAILDLAR